MDFAEVLEKVLELLQRQGRVSYGALKRRFNLDDVYLQDLKDELLFAYAEHVREEGPGLVWAGKGSPESSVQGPESEKVQSPRSKVQNQETQPPIPSPQSLAAERRQLTVMFCDLVGSTALSAQLDPEDYRAVVQQYQQTCAEVIQRHDGYLAQYLGDGLLVYFGYPTAYEDGARRAVRTGLEIITILQKQVPSPLVGTLPLSPSPSQGEGSTSSVRAGEGKNVTQLQSTPHPNLLPQGEKELRKLQVRIGIHTGLVVIGDIGASGRTEQLALGETPNIAARIQGLAEPNTVIVSAATQRLVDGQFECRPFGSHIVKGIDTPIAVYHVQSERQSASPLAGRTTLTPLVGREQEVGLLIDRWEQAKEGRGQVVLLSGEPGIGKSRLAHTLREHVTNEGSLLFEARCSPYHQHSAFYPLIDVLQRTLLLTQQDTNSEKIEKLERVLTLYGMQNSLPLFTALLSLPTPPHYPPLNVTPQKQKERTLQVLVQLLIAQAERQATVSVWEDLHWADPSSLEFLSLLIEQIPTTKLLLLLTFRPEFTPPWKPRSHISQLVLNRLSKKQVEVMIEKVAESKNLSADVIEQIRVKTDGVPLFVEELTKSVVESVGATGRSPLQALAIPATLQEALLARLDRLADARQVAQLGATVGREFSYELLQAVTSLSETDLQVALGKLVEAEILYQRGVGEQVRYFFKHVLIQDTAYQSLLKSTRQQYHQQIAQILEARFPGTKETQPELLAHHYTEAGLIAQAIPYWQQAGQDAVRRSAPQEAINLLSKGLELLKTLPDTPERVQQELTLQIALGVSLTATKSWAAPEIERVYARAQELCQQVGETPQLFPTLYGLWVFYFTRAEYKMARELEERLLSLAQSGQNSAFLLKAYSAIGATLSHLGEFASARVHLEQGIALYEPQEHRSLAATYGFFDPKVSYLTYLSWIFWVLGYPDQALKKVYEAIALAQELSHPFDLALALDYAARLHQFRREGPAAQEQAEAAVALCTEQGFPFWLAWGIIVRSWALAEQGHTEGVSAQMHQGLAVWRATGAEELRPYFLALLAEAYGKAEQWADGLGALDEAMALVDKTGERFYEAELYRLKGELTLQKLSVISSQLSVPSPQPQTPSTRAEVAQEAEECFLKAIKFARKQQAKSLELRASTSLARLWQQQGKKAEAHKLLSDVYNWFTEGFDTKDLQEAKALLESLESDV